MGRDPIEIPYKAPAPKREPIIVPVPVPARPVKEPVPA